MNQAGSSKRQAARRNVAPPFLQLKANALALPLRANSVPLVIATPPHFGVKNLGTNGFCTSDAKTYDRLIAGVLGEARRVLRPGGRVAIYTREGGTRIRKVFDVFQKRRRQGKWRLERAGEHTFAAPYVDVDGFWWWAVPLSIYRTLIARYSAKGEAIAHVFSGSGNGAIAAIKMKRTVVMVDLHYHALARRRLRAACVAPASRRRRA